ncbi:DUF2946 domain-containing protein [Duganella lactea]|uniref:DUF2946 domain-containing protein n=1 Tax=Duganella lactea TaxID=2692173 RepID=UPI001E5D3D03|nr:DUF2946 domain-containing protein [Duganella lactea]
MHIWIAILAILFSAIAPTISHSLAGESASVLTLEICTVNGYKVVNATDSDSGTAPAKAKHGMEHCAFCTTHGSTFALTSSSSIVFAIDSGRDLYPPLFFAAPHSLHAWSAANPRAPPILA